MGGYHWTRGWLRNVGSLCGAQEREGNRNGKLFGLRQGTGNYRGWRTRGMCVMGMVQGGLFCVLRRMAVSAATENH